MGNVPAAAIRRKGGNPDLRDLLSAAGKDPSAIKVEVGVGLTTTYRALRGHPVSRIVAGAIARALGRTEAEVHAAIARSADRAAARRRSRKRRRQ